MNRAVTIAWTRTVEHRPHGDYTQRFDAYLLLVVDDERDFYLGGALGIDSLTLTWLTGATAAQFVVGVPGTLVQQPVEARSAVNCHRGG
ncbi:hypothetical protein ACHZ98_35055 [Streptomyces sp. MAR4 CNY-716]